MGVTVRQKTKGKGQPWWVFVSHNGKRTSRKIGDKKAAETTASKIRVQLQGGRFGFEEEKPLPTFGDYAKPWIENTIPAMCKPSTVRGYGDTLRLHVLPVFEKTRIDEITRGKVKDFLLGKINKGFSKSTCAHMKHVISGVLNRALDDEIIPANPAMSLGKRFLKDNNQGKTVNALTREELKTLLDAFQEHFSGFYTFVLLLARTGVRLGEAIALKWEDIDFEGRFIHVQRSLVRGVISVPKSGKTRKVDMSLQLMEALKTHPFRSEFIFTNTVGKPIDQANFRRYVFKKALAKAKLRAIRIHDLRHTYATLRIAKGDNIQDVSNQLGHHSVKLTLDVYSHWMPGKKKAEVDALDDYTPAHLSAPYTHPGRFLDEKRTPEKPVVH
jgi:integrase